MSGFKMWWDKNKEFMNNKEDAAQCAWDEARLYEATERGPLVSNEFNCSISCVTEDELRVLVELLCHSKGTPGFDARIARLRDEAVSKWQSRK